MGARQRYEDILKGLAEIRRQRAVAVAEPMARPLKRKEVIAEQPNDEPADEPDLSDIFVANDATAEKILEQRKRLIEEEQEQERVAEELNINRDTYEGRLEAIEELAQRISSGQQPAHWLDTKEEEEEEEVPSTEDQPDEVEEVPVRS